MCLSSLSLRQTGSLNRSITVKDRPDDLLLDRFYLVISISRFQMTGQALLDYYRQRGKAEGHMSELMDVLDPALSSTKRAKPHVRETTDYGARSLRYLLTPLTPAA